MLTTASIIKLFPAKQYHGGDGRGRKREKCLYKVNFKKPTRGEIVEFIKANPFAVVSFERRQTIATHIPIEIADDGDGNFVLEGCVARVNPQRKTLTDNAD